MNHRTDKLQRNQTTLEKNITSEVINSLKTQAKDLTSEQKKMTSRAGIKGVETVEKQSEIKKSKASLGVTVTANSYDPWSELDILDFNNMNDQSLTYDALDLWAQRLIDLLLSKKQIFQRLSKREQFILFRYFYRNNPIVYRAINLIADLIISRAHLKLNKDELESGIISDYTENFYQRWLDRINLLEVLQKILVDYLVYGESYSLVEDYVKTDLQFHDFQKDLVVKKKRNINAWEGKEELEETYQKDRYSIPLATLYGYIKAYYSTYFSVDYTGPRSIKPIPFYDIKDYYTNSDTGYEAINIYKSQSLTESLKMCKEVDDLIEFGYSYAWVDLVKRNQKSDQEPYYTEDALFVDNDIMGNGMFIVVYKNVEEGSRLLRAIDLLLEYEAIRRSISALIDQAGRVGRLVYAEGITFEQLCELQAQVEELLENPNHAIVTNYAVTWQEVEKNLKENLESIINRANDNGSQVANALGVPYSLLSEESSFTGNLILMDIINTQFLSLKEKVSQLVESQIFKPMATRKGLITQDYWGALTLIQPKIEFNKQAIRDETRIESIKDLYKAGNIPLSTVLEALDIDESDINETVLNDMFTTRDPVISDIKTEIARNSAQFFGDSKALVDKLKVGLGLPDDEVMKPADEYKTDEGKEGFYSTPSEQEPSNDSDQPGGEQSGSEEGSEEYESHSTPTEGAPRMDLRKPLNDPYSDEE